MDVIRYEPVCVSAVQPYIWSHSKFDYFHHVLQLELLLPSVALFESH